MALEEIGITHAFKSQPTGSMSEFVLVGWLSESIGWYGCHDANPPYDRHPNVNLKKRTRMVLVLDECL